MDKAFGASEDKKSSIMIGGKDVRVAIGFDFKPYKKKARLG